MIEPLNRAQQPSAVLTGASALRMVLGLALAAIGGIVGMLLTDGGWGFVFFSMTIMPLIVGGFCSWRFRRLKVQANRSRS